MMKTSTVLFALALTLSVACKSSSQPAPIGKRYQVSVAAGVPTQVRVTPRDGWKINLEYKNRLDAKAKPSGTAIKFRHADAKVSEALLSFSVPVKPNHSYEGQVAFAICNPKQCIPVREPIRWKVAKR